MPSPAMLSLGRQFQNVAPEATAASSEKPKGRGRQRKTKEIAPSE